jgi:hypothetical protein
LKASDDVVEAGRVTEIRDDDGLAFINRLSERYVGAPASRTGPRKIFVITPERVRAFMGRGRAAAAFVRGRAR